ncbi:hypothetical protein CERZMDRAFT_46510 [Cercospora zeae-maydis SCOH1-5]|uniref:PHD-type domain-containing protein n=1 Tax=Cercospora zeae-maydis SCOH1-5 TaxID=717836 RepID=A0A6A6F8L8_9PEZI|nr:hypothetical protein CERZMDRAFT_46510 [Cercospora zeae-maydis SCOH1-5]
MAGSDTSPRRAVRTPRALASIEPTTEPAQKKQRLRFEPGGPGGGGRYIDEQGNEMTRAEAHRAVADADGRTPSVTRSTMTTRPRRERPERYAPPPTTPRPRYSNAAAAAAASQASDGYKPREERSWDEFHPELDLAAGLMVFSADEVDGRTSKHDPRLQNLKLNGLETNGDADMQDVSDDGQSGRHGTPNRRKPGRPPRRPESMLSGLGSPPAPRITPLPTHNPKERLNLPKPSYRQYNHFLQYEEDQLQNKVNYVDRTMATVGYQESDRFELPPNVLIRLAENQHVEDEADVSLRLASDGAAEVSSGHPVVGKVEYDMDEQDVAWLDEVNEHRKAEELPAIKPAIFEITMTQIEKEYHALEKRIPKPQPRHAQTHRPRSSSQAAVNGDPNPSGDEPDSKCSICDDGDCENANAIIFCDGCDLAVHQECYGVPFIPEGQWFCRKCKEIGRGTPTCIFCPNVDGAFKQTSTLRWSHLLCAIWIPEVNIANMTFMEPIQDVDKVPKGRWKLSCYICNQRMGACIQCGNKNCYQAFHVTCARRARLFLKMKSQTQGGIDTTALKAFCDKHVPQEWRRNNDTEDATTEAKRWYKHAFKDRKWADSQTAALELGAPPPADGGLGIDAQGTEDTIAVSKRRNKKDQRCSWRLPSGAPVVPQVVYTTVEASLTRFTIRKKKEFVEKVCRYWTLKREARRGAALLKRLQLQLEGFSSMEVTRRSFAGMGAAGGPRLQRRIDFAEMLEKDIGFLKDLTAKVRQREELRLKEVELLRELVDTVYFPIPPLLRPILLRAQKLDEKTRSFRTGFELLAQRLRDRYYTSVSDFSRDLSKIFAEALAAVGSSEEPTEADIEAIHNQLNEVKPGSAAHMALTQEQKDLKRLAKRIVKAVKEPLEAAMKKEAELRGLELEEQLRKLDSMGIFASATSKSGDADGEDEFQTPHTHRRTGSDISVVAGAEEPDNIDADMPDAEAVDTEIDPKLAKESMIPFANDSHTPASKAGSHTSSNVNLSNKTRSDKLTTEPLSPPISRSSSRPSGAPASANDEFSHTNGENHDVFAQGGVPWYLEPFDPVGTTIHEERYTGREVLRAMSEELSDMDEDTLGELAGIHTDAAANEKINGGGSHAASSTGSSSGPRARANSSRKKRQKRSHWSR